MANIFKASAGQPVLRRACRVCGREDVAVNAVGGGLRHHKISPERHAEVIPDQPYRDGRCPGTGDRNGA